MKNLYPKSKGKVYPSPATLSVSSSSSSEAFSVLNILPAAILALTSVLVFEDREVLAYLITRSMKTPLIDEKNKCRPSNVHRPVFDCSCFECYTSFWIRWDASPNRERIHHVIEAFEEHLARGEASEPKMNGKGKNKRASGKYRRSKSWLTEKPTGDALFNPTPSPEKVSLLETENNIEATSLENMKGGGFEVSGLETDAGNIKNEAGNVENDAGNLLLAESAAGNNRSLWRKVLPDVLGLITYRLWTVWNPNV